MRYFLLNVDASCIFEVSLLQQHIQISLCLRSNVSGVILFIKKLSAKQGRIQDFLEGVDFL